MSFIKSTFDSQSDTVDVIEHLMDTLPVLSKIVDCLIQVKEEISLWLGTEF